MFAIEEREKSIMAKGGSGGKGSGGKGSGGRGPGGKGFGDSGLSSRVGDVGRKNVGTARQRPGFDVAKSMSKERSSENAGNAGAVTKTRFVVDYRRNPPKNSF
jgi:hypothetical protein